MAYVDSGFQYIHKRVGPGTYGKFVCDPDESHGSGVGQDDWVWVLSDGTVKEVNCPECLEFKPNHKPKRGRPKGSKDKQPRKRKHEGEPEQHGPPPDPDWPDVYVKLSPEMAMTLAVICDVVSGSSKGPRGQTEALKKLLEQEGYAALYTQDGKDNCDLFIDGDATEQGLKFKETIPERSQWRKPSKPV
jgi:hypothetical protein